MRNDVVLKEMLQKASHTIRKLGGESVTDWLNSDLAQIKALRPDLLGVREGGGLLHIEIMTRNEPKAVSRMLEYNVAIQISYQQIPDQVLLYTGYERMRMTDRMQTPNFSFRFRLLDARDLDGDGLLESPELGDNVIAVLGRLRDRRRALREILRRIGKLSPVARAKAYSGLLTLAGLRKLEAVVEEEATAMPFDIDIMQNAVLGPRIRKRLAEGRKEGLQQGLQQGLKKGLKTGRIDAQREMLTHLIERRFGSLTPRQASRLCRMTSHQLEHALLRIFDCRSADELLG